MYVCMCMDGTFLQPMVCEVRHSDFHWLSQLQALQHEVFGVIVGNLLVESLGDEQEAAFQILLLLFILMRGGLLPAYLLLLLFSIAGCHGISDATDGGVMVMVMMSSDNSSDLEVVQRRGGGGHHAQK